MPAVWRSKSSDWNPALSSAKRLTAVDPDLTLDRSILAQESSRSGTELSTLTLAGRALRASDLRESAETNTSPILTSIRETIGFKQRRQGRELFANRYHAPTFTPL